MVSLQFIIVVCLFANESSSFLLGFPNYAHQRPKAVAQDQHQPPRNPTLQRKSSTILNDIRFLGKGPDTIVRPGVVLLAPTNEFHHYYRQAAIFVHAMGEDDHGVYVIRGVIVDHPTPFTLEEMLPAKTEGNPLGNNLLARGGDKGQDGVILLHSRDDFNLEEVGTSGIYQGGWDQALAACASGKADVSEFRCFFNYVEFTEPELEELLESNEDGDCWSAVEIESDLVLSEEWDRGDCWKRLRNAAAIQMNL